MNVNESIARLRVEHDAFGDEMRSLIDSDDTTAQAKMLLCGIAIAKEYERLKSEGLAAIQARLDRQGTTESTRISTLVETFAIAASLANTLHDKFRDIEGETQVACFTVSIVKNLEDMAVGRGPLAVLLDHPDAGVRAWAGACLINSQPDRVVPILRNIKDKEVANGAHFTAYFALLRWEHDSDAHKK